MFYLWKFKNLFRIFLQVCYKRDKTVLPQTTILTTTPIILPTTIIYSIPTIILTKTATTLPTTTPTTIKSTTPTTVTT